MFIIFGISPVKRLGKLRLRSRCPRCNDIRNFQENSVRNFLSFFFIPIIPISRSNSFYTCPTCGFAANLETIHIEPDYTNDQPIDIDPTERVVVTCQRCEGAMYIPLNERRQLVTCPHCTMEFIVKGIKGVIPSAAVQYN